MNARRYALIAFLALLAIFGAANILASQWLAGWRLDLTENRLYSLSPGSRATLEALNEPVTLTLYLSREAAAEDPAWLAYGQRVREMLQTYARASNGRVRVAEIEPKRFTDDEDEALAAGLQPVATPGRDPIFLGIVGSNAVDEQIVIPQLSPEREAYLEYELTRMIAELQNPKRPRVALITSLDWRPEAAESPSAGMFGDARQPYVSRELARFADVETLPRDFSAIGPEIDALVIVHPWALSDAQLYAVDQFVLAKGRAFIAVDPAAVTAGSDQAPLLPDTAPTSGSSNLSRLLNAWGVSVSPDVVLDAQNALPVPVPGPYGQDVPAPQPLFFIVPPAQVSDRDLLTAGLERGVNFGAPGAISWRQTEGVEVSELMHTSGETMTIPAARALTRPGPQEILSQFQPAGKRETVAARISGKLPTAFPQGRPEGAVGSGEVLRESQTEAMIVLVSDVDFLSDGFFLAGDAGGAPLADNPVFALSAVDQLTNATPLLSLRARAPSVRRMTALAEIRNRAQTRQAATQEQLQSDLEATQRQLEELQRSGRGSGAIFENLGVEMTSDERQAIERLRTRLVEARRELRESERGYRTELDRLKSWIMLLNVWLIPVLVAGGGLFWVWRRQHRLAPRAIKKAPPTTAPAPESAESEPSEPTAEARVVPEPPAEASPATGKDETPTEEPEPATPASAKDEPRA